MVLTINDLKYNKHIRVILLNGVQLCKYKYNLVEVSYKLVSYNLEETYLSRIFPNKFSGILGNVVKFGGH